MTISVAEETNTPSAGNNEVCSDRRSGENKCSNGEGTRIGDRSALYAIEVDRGRNCYACGKFGHLARHCRN